MAEANREEAERACRRAEEHFLAGNVAAARRLAGKAQRLFPSLPGVANAVAAYAVHAAAPDWHAVLGVDRPASADAVKRQFRRLSLLVHPDKNRSAAAEGAFKLLGKACDALTSGATDAASAQEWFRSHHSTPAKAPSANPPAPQNPPPPADKAESSRRAASGATGLVRVRCDYCKKAREVKRSELTSGLVRCLRCHSVLREASMATYVWESSGTYYKVRPPSPPPPYYQVPNKCPPPPPQRKKDEPQVPTFRCPALCPRCETQFTSMVTTGSWLLQCKNCLKDAMVHVKGPDVATCT
ncbi:hypothetical protein ACQ4PT_002443 [Festuca glaucescens]